jgi:hypothetical protein
VRRSRATPQQKELAAILWANGRDDQYIQDELALSAGQLRRIKKSTEWEDVALRYRERQASISARHRERYLDMAEDAAKAIRDIVRDPHTPAKARIEAVRYIEEQAKVSEVRETTKHEINVGFQQNNMEVNNHIEARTRRRRCSPTDSPGPSKRGRAPS